MTLGLISEGDGMVAQVLAGLGADMNAAREQVIRLLDETRARAQASDRVMTLQRRTHDCASAGSHEDGCGPYWACVGV